MSVWGTTEAMPFSAATLQEAAAAGASQIVQLPCNGYVAGFNADPAPTVPQSVTAYQLLMQMNALGQYANLMTYVNAQPAPVQIAFNQTNFFNRSNPMVLAAATALNFTPAQMDALFIAAAALPPAP